MSDPRKCIFTGQIANFSMKITPIEDEKHNWAKAVPCTKEFFDSLEGRPLNKYEFKLVELFYEQEVSRLNTARLQEKIECVRKLADKRRMEDRIDERVGISEQLGAYRVDIGEEYVTKHISELDIPLIEEFNDSEFEEIREVETPIMTPNNGKGILQIEPMPELPDFEDKHIKKFLEDQKVTEDKEDDKVKKVVKKKKNNLWG